MTVLLGDKQRFGMEVGDWVDSELRQVDLWIAGQRLTCDDNLAFVKQFRLSVAGTARWMRSGGGSPPPFPGLSPVAAHRRLVDESEDFEETAWNCRFFGWGPTTDNLQAFAFREGAHLTITVAFWREEHLREHPEHAGKVWVAELRTEEFLGLLEELVAIIDRDS
ncbi:hypothetical protein ACQPZZ_20435 [Microbispora sp. CA-135349]|uniref:hypothetical protein n=1 Tax=Microbispora sp. CA-135349 TaxID=3239953 RepID=UPI003D9271FD